LTWYLVSSPEFSEGTNFYFYPDRLNEPVRGENPDILIHTTEPHAGPVVPVFPQPPDFRGHNPGKHRNRAGMNGSSPAGTSEVAFSDVTGAESRGGPGLGCGGDWQGGIGKTLIRF